MSNREEVVKLINKIKRTGFKKEELINYLDTSDFYIAPASAKYHSSYEGGLCDHCLNVYRNLKMLVDKKDLFDKISETSIILVSLFHDMSKINLYTKDVRNKKVYSPAGTKYDNRGNYEWVAEEFYTVKPADDQFIFGNHEETAEFMLRCFVPLTVEESVAILHHMGGKSWDSAQDNLAAAYNKYSLACLLHLADMLSTYVDEKDE